MKIKKFTAKTFSEALTLVKKELSQDAIILSTEEKHGLRPHVEVTAAVDYDTAGRGVKSSEVTVHREPQKQISEQSTKNTDPAVRLCAERVTPYGTSPALDYAASDLKSEINSLRLMIESMKNNGYEVSLPSKKRAMMTFLRERSIREEYALRLCDRTTNIDEIPLMISADIKIKRQTGSRKAVMLMGPTGVGKTTTLAKLAAQAVKAGKKAAIINLDTFRIGAVEQVRIYSRILGIPLITAHTGEEFRSNLAKYAANRDIVYIDTTGRNPRDEAYIESMADLCKTDVPLELHLLMGANIDDESMIEAYRSYRRLPIDYLTFTKVDEAVRFGPLYNILVTYQKPVAYLTTGQRVPGDIESATVNRLAGLIVNKECNAC
ncbi:MAG TPA: flagellar biosynthesis protein FlhF [Nitrospirota bacterium]|nr:flagellar biosynthesis protein FlhF [Nitrospirota bacterium]